MESYSKKRKFYHSWKTVAEFSMFKSKIHYLKKGSKECKEIDIKYLYIIISLEKEVKYINDMCTIGKVFFICKKKELKL